MVTGSSGIEKRETDTHARAEMKYVTILTSILFVLGCGENGSEDEPIFLEPNSDNVGDENGDHGGNESGASEPDENQAGEFEVTPPSFENDPATATGSLAGMRFRCTAGGEYAGQLGFLAGGELAAQLPDDPNAYPGSWSVSGAAVTIDLPLLELTDTTHNVEVALDLPVGLYFNVLDCHAIALSMEGQPGADRYRCPAIKYIPEVSYEDNELYFDDFGTVRRRRWRELVAANDTLYSDGYGVYRRQGDVIYMVFAPFWEQERELHAVLESDGLYIQELEPERGPCTPS